MKSSLGLDGLADFLVKAKVQAYAGDGREVSSQRAGFKELEFVEGDWSYRDSYSGFFFAPGQEVVRFKGVPVWAMAYSGGMLLAHHGDVAFARETFAFLKQALLKIEISRPFRGPIDFEIDAWKYYSACAGDISDFVGNESIFFRGKRVFDQRYMGGIIVPK